MIGTFYQFYTCMIRINFQVDNPREVQFAQNAVFSRHPEMEQWPKGNFILI